MSALKSMPETKAEGACCAPGWRAAYGVGPAGAALVRPDGFVGWRSVDGATAPQQEIERALDQILGRAPDPQ